MQLTSDSEYSVDTNKMREVVQLMGSLSQTVLSAAKQLEDAITSSGQLSRNGDLAREMQSMLDKKQAFVYTMSQLGEWLKFHRDSLNRVIILLLL